MKSIVDTVVLQTITAGEITTWITRLENGVINPALEPYYSIPVTTITRGSTYYPYPVTEVSAHLTAGTICSEIFSQGEPEVTARGLALVQQAMSWIEDIQMNRTRLEGQRRKGNIHFQSPRLVPHLPKAATPTPSTQGIV